MTDLAAPPVGVRSLPLRSVTIEDQFWAPRRELVRTRTLPQQEQQLREGGQFDALRLEWRPGDADEPHIFWESDVAKWIEAASYSLAKQPDPALEESVDEAISLLAGAQQPDGYLNTYFTVVRPGERFTDLRDGHELYCAGHLIEAGVAHFEATGKRTLLDVVQRYADLIETEFGPGGSAEGGYDGHQEIELALVKLAAATGEVRYRQLATRMIDARGRRPFYFEAEEARRGTTGYFGDLFPQRPEEAERFRQYNQSHQPVREQASAVGHSVRAMYMYSAMTDLANLNDDAGLRHATEQLWDSTTDRKMYLTGGLGADPSIEGFSADFVLPLEGAYAETCAAIGLVFWAQRMAQLTGEARYIDVLERALYNGVLSGASDQGTHYFYGNPMQSDGSAARQEWFGVACCPPNFARLIESLELYAYSQGPDQAIVNLYISGTARFRLDGQDVGLQVQSNAPWGGDVRIQVNTATAATFQLDLRIPEWAESHRLQLNGQVLAAETSSGYLRLQRNWEPGDVLELELMMGPARVPARPEVESTRGRTALQRGPLVYCLEGIDNVEPVDRLMLPNSSTLTSAWDPERELMLITAAALDEDAAAEGEPAEVTMTAVPYFSWANRGAASMELWIRDRPRTAQR